ncbi:uncharacterized protein LOC108468279 [Gossypium arboreum]|uniref:uncharacterized protein LOC108468279 n=1 Tax=Gossypium arboreum TaxID=29729 RepID=UPI00081950D6|nr:uncharacterized protein LOC108468279 [Gossypium arboreum]
MDIVTALPLSPSKKNATWGIVDRLTMSAHFIAVRTDWSLQKLAEVYIREIVRLHDIPVSIISNRDPQFTSRFWRQKSYADLKCRDIEYAVGDKIIERVGPVTYRLALPLELQKIHDVFHVSMLRRYRSDHSHINSTEDIEIRPDLSYEEEPVKILAREVKKLRNRQVPLVKVLWKSHNIEKATWESEETMRS